MEILGRRREDPDPLPRWGGWARTVFRALLTLWSVLLLISLVTQVGWLLLDLPRREGGGIVPDTWWVLLPGAVLGGGMAVSGLVWLAAEAVRGYRESTD